jgi:uncharacterized membrane protein YdjX (TVP38/TMEM64 family)
MMKIKKIKFIIFIIFLIISLGGFFVSLYLGYDSQDVSNILKQYYFIAPFLFTVFVILVSATTFPITIILIPGVLFFPITSLIIYTATGKLIGAFLVYFLAKYLGKDFLEEYLDLKRGRLKALNNLSHKNLLGLTALFICVYFFPSLIGYSIAGIKNIKLHIFTIITIIGDLANTFLVVAVIYGITHLNYNYIIFPIILILFITIISFILFRKDIKEVMVIGFGKKIEREILE